ncbi:MAG: phage holin family protein [Dehalococcoidia bacterium]
MEDKDKKDKKGGPVRGLIVRLAVNAGALCTAAWLVPGIHIEGWKAILIAALIFGVVNAFIKPLISILTCLIQVITLGLFTFVINAGMLYLTAWLTHALDLTFEIDNFWSALVGAIIVSVSSFILTKILR